MIEAGMFVGIGLILVTAATLTVVETRRRKEICELERRADELRGLYEGSTNSSRQQP